MTPQPPGLVFFAIATALAIATAVATTVTGLLAAIGAPLSVSDVALLFVIGTLACAGTATMGASQVYQGARSLG